MALDADPLMRPGTCGSPSWQRLCRYAVYVDADLLVATRINTLADGAGHTFSQALVPKLTQRPIFRYHLDPPSLEVGRSESRNTQPVKRTGTTEPENVCIP